MRLSSCLDLFPLYNGSPLPFMFFGQLLTSVSLASRLTRRCQRYASTAARRGGEGKGLEKWVVEKIRNKQKERRQQQKQADQATSVATAGSGTLPRHCDGTTRGAIASSWNRPIEELVSMDMGGESIRQERPSCDVGGKKMGPMVTERNKKLSSRERLEPNGTAEGDDVMMVRLDKVCGLQGLCSRNEASRYIDMGLVMVDGEIASGNRLVPWQRRPLDGKANSSSCIVKVELANRAVEIQKQKKTFLLNKPLNYLACPSRNAHVSLPLCLSLLVPDRRACDCRVDPSKCKHLSPAGRLDADSTGLIVYTQDGRLCSLLCGSSFTSPGDSQEELKLETVDKEYQVKAEGGVSEDTLSLLRHGLSLDGVELLPAEVDRIEEPCSEDLLAASSGAVWLRFVLREGRNRQIRRMCALVGLHVLRIHRVRIGAVSLLDLSMGRWRLLKPGESFL
eukprot:GHVS01074484.1.p1 GENE.GHVS01074484.1~~GHVS01074484.1.p1  ORF type:complete len:450 (-),score=63.23 GHVS01074484.1:159-1508(-)